MRRVLASVLVAGFFLASAASQVQAASPSPGAVPSLPAAPACNVGGFGSGPPPASTGTDPAIVARIGGTAATMPFPGAIVVDSTFATGRVFVSNSTKDTVSVIQGRTLDPADIHIETKVTVGNHPASLALDPSTGVVYVALGAECKIVEIDGRAGTPTTLRNSAVLPDNASFLAFDPKSNRLFVGFQTRPELRVYGADLKLQAAIALPGNVTALAVDSTRDLVYAGTLSYSAGVGGAIVVAAGISVIDAGATKPGVVGSTFPVSYCSAIVPDPASGAVLVVDAGSSAILTLAVGSGDILTRTSIESLDPLPPATSQSSSSPQPLASGQHGYGYAVAAILLPGRHALLVPLTTRAAALVYDIGTGGSLNLVSDIEGVQGGTDAALDSVTGRVFVSEAAANEVAVVAADSRVAPAPAIAEVLPGPFDVSLAPADVARSIGITMLLMLLLGAPTTIFNSTLAANRTLLERWARRRRPKWMRSRKRLTSAGGAIKRLSTTWFGLLVYLGLATLLYSFLDSGFPRSNSVNTFSTVLFGIAVGTALSQVPGELYVRRRYQSGGKLKVALWTLGLAAGCVVVTRVTAVQPGYVYGIIGGFTFSKVALTGQDKGRMAFRGLVILLAAGFVAWFVRVPFQVGGPIGGGAGAYVDNLLTRLFISCIEGCAIALIPLQYLQGEKLFAWSRARWAVLWAASLLLFAHVILYPVSSFEPNPSPTGLWTVAVTVVVYSAFTMAFWWFFRRRDSRKRRRRAKVAAVGEAKAAALGAVKGAAGPSR